MFALLLDTVTDTGYKVCVSSWQVRIVHGTSIVNIPRPQVNVHALISEISPFQD